MELSRLAAKQKRYMDVLLFTESEVLDSSIKPNLLKVLAEYKGALANCWKEQKITEQDIFVFGSLERELDALYNQAHLRSNLT